MSLTEKSNETFFCDFQRLAVNVILPLFLIKGFPLLRPQYLSEELIPGPIPFAADRRSHV